MTGFLVFCPEGFKSRDGIVIVVVVVFQNAISEDSPSSDCGRLFCRKICPAYPREVVKSTLRHNAAACILCHNHPSGDSRPSQADQTITARVKEALNVIEVRTLDHVVVGERPYSFAEHGLM